MKPIPTELRKRILDDIADGMTEIAVAKKWKVSQSFIAKLKRRVRETGNLEPKISKTGPKHVTKNTLEPHQELLKNIVAKTPDATLEEIRAQLPIKVTTPTVFHELRRLKLTYKKTASRERAAPTRHRRKATGMESKATRL